MAMYELILHEYSSLITYDLNKEVDQAFWEVKDIWQ